MKAHPQLRKACFFLGYPRSGHTLIGALLDAHPNCCISHQQDILGQLLRAEITKEEMVERIILNSRQQVAGGRTNAGYSYLIPQQWQGQFTDLQVIGDKSGGRSSRLIDDYSSTVEKLPSKLQLDICFIHVIRNPYDAISTSVNRAMERRPATVLEDIYSKKMERFFGQARAIQQFQQRTNFLMYNLYFEQFVQHTEEHLRHLIEWMGLSETEGYVQDCADIIFAKPNKARRNTTWWTTTRIEQVAERIALIPFLQDYHFASAHS